MSQVYFMLFHVSPRFPRFCMVFYPRILKALQQDSLPGLRILHIMDWLRATPAIYSSYLINNDFLKQKMASKRVFNTNLQ